MALPRSVCVQGYLAHKKQRPPRTLQQDYAWGPVVVQGVEAVFNGPCTPVFGLTNDVSSGAHSKVYGHLLRTQHANWRRVLPQILSLHK